MTAAKKFSQFLIQKFPSLEDQKISELISDHLISPYVLKLDQNLFSKLQTEVTSFYKLREWTLKTQSVEFAKKGLIQNPNLSVCMSFDFHLTPQQELKLIEINTNASFLALGTLLNEFNQVSTSFTIDHIRQMFQHEQDLLGLQKTPIYIMDENPHEQKLYCEFLIYNQILTNSHIINSHDIQNIQNPSLIYNRYTDFYLEHNNSLKIKEMFNQKKIFLSPQPIEYFLLADKGRFYEWQNQNEIPLPSSLLKSYELTPQNKDEIWALRKKLFFKPKNSFGSKQVYKGASISKKTFDLAFENGLLAQEFAEPSSVNFEVNNISETFKYDLRCFVYNQKVQLVVARLFQGQVTNLNTFGGGFASVHFI